MVHSRVRDVNARAVEAGDLDAESSCLGKAAAAAAAAAATLSPPPATKGRALGGGSGGDGGTFVRLVVGPVARHPAAVAGLGDAAVLGSCSHRGRTGDARVRRTGLGLPGAPALVEYMVSFWPQARVMTAINLIIH